MNDYGSPEHQRLREAAFRRGGSEADVEALALFEASIAPTQPPPALEHAPVHREPEADASDAFLESDPPPDVETVDPPRRWPALRRAAAILALAAAAAGGAAISHTVANSTPVSSLRIFEFPAEEENPSRLFTEVHSGGGEGSAIVITQSRLLGTYDGWLVYGGLGAMNLSGDSDTPVWATAVCLALENEDGTGGASCTHLDDFRERGISMNSPEGSVLWGPTGELQHLETGLGPPAST